MINCYNIEKNFKYSTVISMFSEHINMFRTLSIEGRKPNCSWGIIFLSSMTMLNFFLKIFSNNFPILFVVVYGIHICITDHEKFSKNLSLKACIKQKFTPFLDKIHIHTPYGCCKKLGCNPDWMVVIPCSDKHFYCVNLNKCHYWEQYFWYKISINYCSINDKLL